MYLLGFDIGSSSIKAALVRADDRKVIHVISAPDKEMPIDSPEKYFAEQDPEMWWKYICECSQKLMEAHPEARDKIAGIGLAYQMHGLVLIDSAGKVLRPSIIWCDSRAVDTGDRMEEELGSETLLRDFYNLPGNLTFSKLRWVQQNQPEIFAQTDKILWPGDYIAYRMTGEARTSITGLSEGVLWNFTAHKPGYELLEKMDIPDSLIPLYAPSFSIQGYVHREGAQALGLDVSGKIPVSYRSGDQPNNAWSLNVNEPGVMAGTGGTSAVLYGISENPVIDKTQRTNSFAHINYTPDQPRIGTLLCINGAGILYSWIRKNITGQEFSYGELEQRAASVSPGSDGLMFLPFGNGAERMLENKPVQAHLLNLDLNRHHADHLIRAGLEGIGFAYVYGYEIMENLGLSSKILRVGNDNLFQSDIFSSLVAGLCDLEIEVREATGAVGAALGAGLGAGYYNSAAEAMSEGRVLQSIAPDRDLADRYRPFYEEWKKELQYKLDKL